MAVNFLSTVNLPKELFKGIQLNRYHQVDCKAHYAVTQGIQSS